MYKVLIVFALVSCGTIRGPSWVNPDLLEHYSRFLAEADKRGVHLYSGPITVTFVEALPGNVIGVCDVYPHKREVLILKGFWEGHNDYDKELLMFHELGHCLLDQDHRDHKIGRRDGSIMNPTHVWWPYYKEHREEYLDELFGG